MRSCRQALAALAVLAALTLLALPTQANAAAIGYLDSWGCPLTSPQPESDFHGVHSVAVRQNGDTVWVAENSHGTGQNRVMALSPSGKLLTSWTSGAKGPFSEPVLGVSSDGVYVGSGSFAPSVQRFAASGTSATPGAAWGPTPEAYFELGVRALTGSQVGGTEFMVVVEEPDLTGNTNVFMFRADGLALTRLTGDAFDTTIPYFQSVTGVAAAGGYLWVADQSASGTGARLMRFKLGSGPTGGLALVDGKAFSLPASPGPIWGTNDGVWVAMRDTLRTFAKFDLNGAEAMRFNENDVPGGLNNVTGIAADQFDDVYLADTSRVIKFGPGGDPRGTGGRSVLPKEKCIGTVGTLPGGTPTPPSGGGTGSPEWKATSARSFLRAAGPVYTVRCRTPCVASASGKVQIPAAGRTYLTTRVYSSRYRLATTLHPRVGVRALRGIRAALARGYGVFLTVKLGVLDANGAKATKTIYRRLA